MTLYSGTTTAVESVSAMGVKRVYLYTQDDAVAGDTVDITLTDYGIGAAGLLSVQSWVQTTAGSVITEVANTTAVSSGVLTVTFAGTGVCVMEIVGLLKPDYTSA